MSASPSLFRYARKRRAGEHAPDVAHPAEDDHAEDEDRDVEEEVVARDAVLRRGVVGAGDAAEEGAAGVGPGLRPHQRDAHRGGGRLVLADRDPRPPEPRVAQPQRAEDREHEQQDREPVEQVGGGDLVVEDLRVAAREEARGQERRRWRSRGGCRSPGWSIGLIPSAPFVMLKPPMLSPFRATCGRISPKPSVTIAR